MKRYGTTILMTVVLVLIAMDPLHAEVRREGGDDAVRKAQYMLRQLSQENQGLKARNAELQARLDELGKKHEDAGNKLQALPRPVNSMAQPLSSTMTRFWQTRLPRTVCMSVNPT